MNAFKYNKDAKYSIGSYNLKTIDVDSLIVSVGSGKF